MGLATKLGVGMMYLIILYLVLKNEKNLNNAFKAVIGGTNKQIAALQGR